MYQEIHISSRYTKHTNYFSYNLFFRPPRIFLNIQSYVKNCYSRFSYVLSNNTGTAQWSRRQLVPRYCANIFTQNLISARISKNCKIPFHIMTSRTTCIVKNIARVVLNDYRHVLEKNASQMRNFPKSILIKQDKTGTY